MSAIKAGDVVLHRPTGETWIVAAAAGSAVFPAGWPCSQARAEDCEIKESACEEASMEMVRKCAAMDGWDVRASISRRILYEAKLRAIGIDPKNLAERTHKVVCLCGSGRFMDVITEEARRFTLMGWVVLRPEVVSSQDALSASDKERLDYLHFTKIDLAGLVFVVNVDGYIGPSTAREIAYAELRGTSIEYLEPQAGGTPAPPEPGTLEPKARRP